MSSLEQFQRIFGERIKAHRRRLRLTQLQLSERLHISRTMLANIETGVQRTSVFLLARFAQELEVSIEDLVPSIAEAESRFQESRKVSLATESKPAMLSRELEELDISVDTGSTLEKALKEVHHQNDGSTNIAENQNDKSISKD